MPNEAGEIDKLLRKIDQDTERIKYLETRIEIEKKSKKELERRLMILEELQAKSSYQKSRILRERDSMVREMSVEIDNISARLKNSVNENVDWKRRYLKLEKIYEELEGDFFRVKSQLESRTKELGEKETELKQIREVMEMYQNLKKDVQIKEHWEKQEKSLIHLRAQEISAHYTKLKEDILYSQGKLKKMIFRNSRILIDTPAKLVRGERERLEQKILSLTKDNLYLKKELLNVLQQIIERNSRELGEQATPEKDGIFQNVSKEGAFLKGSILSFSNNNIGEMSFEKDNWKQKIPSPERTKVSERNEELQRSAVINAKKFQKIQALYKESVPLHPVSLHISKNKSECN